jgi:hypothetical protein
MWRISVIPDAAHQYGLAHPHARRTPHRGPRSDDADAPIPSIGAILSDGQIRPKA